MGWSGGFGEGYCNPHSIGGNSGSGAVGAAVTAAATANTKGAWTQLIAATPADCVFAIISIQQIYGNRFAIDIGIGPAGSEIVLVPNIVCDVDNTSSGCGCWMITIPLQIPAGIRIAARCQSSAASAVTHVSITTFDGHDGSCIAGVDAIGFNSASTYGTAVTPSGTAGTKGPWNQLIAATTNDYLGFFACFDWNGSTGQYGGIDIDIGIGPSGSEVIIVPDICTGSPGTYNQFFPIFPILQTEIPAGTRIAARSSATNPPMSFGMTLYGVF
jgi:hypothetical protein